MDVLPQNTVMHISHWKKLDGQKNRNICQEKQSLHPEVPHVTYDVLPVKQTAVCEQQGKPNHRLAK
jgi:hypothetical protein